MKVIKIFIILAVAAAGFLPAVSSALTMDELLGVGLGQVLGVSDVQTSSYATVVMNQVTGEVVISKNATSPWVPASLTKLVTAQVILDLNPNFKERCVVRNTDNVGGAHLYANNGGVYYLQDLLAAMLIGSANNAANALANCTGMTREQFAQKMNDKAKSLGATNSFFFEPSGINEHNQTSALDLAKIAQAAFSTSRIREIAQKKSVYFCSVGGAKKCHTIKNTNKLFGDPGVDIIAGKTGYLDESRYNFAASSKNGQGNYLITVLLGNPTQQEAFDNTRTASILGFEKLNKTLASASFINFLE
jgi:D-alanyl-D-alanine endopeptidase (penicillin-binding protein 7)